MRTVVFVVRPRGMRPQNTEEVSLCQVLAFESSVGTRVFWQLATPVLDCVTMPVVVMLFAFPFWLYVFAVVPTLLGMYMQVSSVHKILFVRDVRFRAPFLADRCIALPLSTALTWHCNITVCARPCRCTSRTMISTSRSPS